MNEQREIRNEWAFTIMFLVCVCACLALLALTACGSYIVPTVAP